MPRSVTIVDYDPQWPLLFERERSRLLPAMGDRVVSFQHVGSTSVPGLSAKPTVDMMVGVRQEADAQDCVPLLIELGYTYKPATQLEIPGWYFLDRRTADGEDYHLHMVVYGSDFWNRHLLFRDYLRSHPEVARQYEALKRELAFQYGTDRMGYCDAKTDFIQSVEALARHAANS